MTGAAATLGALVVVVACTALAPWIGIRMLAPSLEASPLARRVNFRGREVFIGLGIVWVFWVGGMIVLRWGGQLAPATLGVFSQIGAVSALTVTAVLFGLIDDAYGTGVDRGFRGHLSALGRGQLSTGAFKLLGIGLVSLAAAASVDPPRALSALGTPAVLDGGFALWVGWTLVLGAVIALSANLVNLMDLRPSRALKVSGAYVVVLAVGAFAAHPALSALELTLALAGPLVAVWALDAGERGMLGDAGANAAGAALGFVAAWECGRSWPALVVAAGLLALNLASEKWSFTRLIAGNRVLSYLDGLGRDGREIAPPQNSAKTSPQSSNPDS